MGCKPVAKSALWARGTAAWLAGLGLASVATGWPETAAAQQRYQYTADLAAPARQQGTVTAAGIAWGCQGPRCTTAGPWPTPGVGACKALAQLVGRIQAYGHSGSKLTAAQLAECNATLQAAVPTPSIVAPGVLLPPGQTVPPSGKTQAGKTGAPGSAGGGAAVVAPSGSVAGTAARRTPAAAAAGAGLAGAPTLWGVTPEARERASRIAVRPRDVASRGSDCDDTRSSVHPNQPESRCDGMDDNCDGQIDEDLRVVAYFDRDGDRYGDPSSGTLICPADMFRDRQIVNDNTDCNDADIHVNPLSGCP